MEEGFCVLLEKGPTLKGNILGANCFLLEDILEVCVVQKSKQEVAKAVALVKMAEKIYRRNQVPLNAYITHLFRMDYSTFILWTGTFPGEGMFG